MWVGHIELNVKLIHVCSPNRDQREWSLQIELINKFLLEFESMDTDDTPGCVPCLFFYLNIIDII